MYIQLTSWLQRTQLQNIAAIIAYIASIIIALVVAVLIHKITRAVLVKFFTRRKSQWAGILVANRFFGWVAAFVLPVSLSLVVADIAMHEVFWQRSVAVLVVVISMFLADALIRSASDIYKSYDVSKAVPLGGVLQVLEIVVFVVGGIVLVSIFVERSPTAILGGLGAMTAIVTIVFKDAILGFVAGIQLAANDMVRVGDIIEMPQREIGGTVLDISLMTVKIEGFDKTIIAVPAYAFVSEPFINRRGITNAGARRILRSFSLDAKMVRILAGEECEQIAKNVAPVQLELTAGISNLQLFRQYLTAYLHSRQDIRQDLTVLVRQQDITGGTGIPLEIFAFSTEVDLIPYENVQSQIFEHVCEILQIFDLALYQRGV